MLSTYLSNNSYLQQYSENDSFGLYEYYWIYAFIAICDNVFNVNRETYM
jgi:hypothetical protein